MTSCRAAEICEKSKNVFARIDATGIGFISCSNSYSSTLPCDDAF